MKLTDPLNNWIARWLMAEEPRKHPAPCDFERICHEIRPGDVLLIEGRSRVSEVIRVITQSPWSHSVLYIGRIHDIENEAVRTRIERLYAGDSQDPLIIEALLGEGVILTSLGKYHAEHIRICRPRGLTFVDSQRVINHAIDELGKGYNVRQLLDLARLMFPWAILPRHWRSVLFQHNVQTPTKTVCSTVISEAFASVSFPILPVVQFDDETGIRMFRRDPRLAVPRDFDYSPYFDIIKYPLVPIDESGFYRNLPWSKPGAADDAPSNDEPLTATRVEKSQEPTND
ncbi:MAG: hypothetical protein DRQ60_02040 [Gammaproteobacteria bacterium]|nr:MAG: hypothetical protein DRQ54_00800 [Gammaproteobacteria bacterium]RLA15804.1 MAG: hypothetical protein DRQ52_00945 [Gammaproteobacteria bacterium]RLA17415.1 MAG: hypothetical protein DRQ60_02040 [Gammaproteobacteria bacterium]